MMFRPILFDTLKHYSRQQFVRDVMAGIIVGVVALPLAIAFGIASGVSPEKGLYTAVIAGFIISAMGGSTVQIGGPTGAFIVIVYGIVQQYGINGLIIATFLAGVMLIVMGLARLGSVIKYIPYPLIIGFTSGIALIIFSLQIKDFLGLDMTMPSGFFEKWVTYFHHLSSINLYAVMLSVATVAIVLLWPRISSKIPGSLVAIIVTTAATHLLALPVETIGSRFGEISSGLPAPVFPDLDFDTIRHLVQPAFTIALLCGIESLLSAVVADGMTGHNHKSNIELVGQGTANIFSSIFGGIPATGAIARTATNIKNGGRTPVAGMVHAVVLLLIILFVGKWAALIPMATLAGILVIVAYNMSEWQHFISMLKGPRSDVAVLLITFILTVLVDITVAIEIGMVIAVLLFLRQMIQSSRVHVVEKRKEGLTVLEGEHTIPPEVEVFEITGPLFFGAAYKFRDAIKFIKDPPEFLIIRMLNVPIIDATGIKVIRDVYNDTQKRGTRLLLSEVESEQVMQELKDARLLFAIGKANVTDSFEKALKRCKVLIAERREATAGKL